MSGKKRGKKQSVSLDNVPVDDPEAQADPNDPHTLDGDAHESNWLAQQREIERAIALRALQESGYPDDDAIRAMEDPLAEVMGAAFMVRDITYAALGGYDVHPLGLAFLGDILQREAERLFCLYHGHPPRGG